MTNKELISFIKENKKEVDKINAEFEKHSNEFDRKMKEILSAL